MYLVMKGLLKNTDGHAEREVACQIRLNLDGAYDSENEIEEVPVVRVKDEPLDDHEDAAENDANDPLAEVGGGAGLPASKSSASADQCRLCLDWFSTHDGLLLHLVFLHGQHYCPVCHDLFETRADKDLHQNARHGQVRPSCDQCKTATFETRSGLNVHSLREHGVFRCPFCNYVLSRSSMQMHLSKNHLVDWTQFEPEAALDVDAFRVIYDQTKLTAKCVLCHKKVARDKVLGHVRYFHHFSLHQAVALLLSAGFTLNPAVYNTFPEVVVEEKMAPTGTTKSSDVLYISSSKNQMLTLVYDCPLSSCRQRLSDYGLHMLAVHRRTFCPHCRGFFQTRAQRDAHMRAAHPAVRYCCQNCPEARIDSLHELIFHRMHVHQQYTCLLCENLVFSTEDNFQSHWLQHHAATQEAFSSARGSQDSNLLMQRVIDTPLLKIVPGNNVSCELCQNFQLPLLANTSQMYKHLLGAHHVRYFETLFQIFDGQQSVLTSLSDGGVDGTARRSADKHGRKEIEEGFVSQEIHPCIMCKRVFNSSVRVQQHLLRVHMSRRLSDGEDDDGGGSPSSPSVVAATATNGPNSGIWNKAGRPVRQYSGGRKKSPTLVGHDSSGNSTPQEEEAGTFTSRKGAAGGLKLKIRIPKMLTSQTEKDCDARVVEVGQEDVNSTAPTEESDPLSSADDTGQVGEGDDVKVEQDTSGELQHFEDEDDEDNDGDDVDFPLEPFVSIEEGEEGGYDYEDDDYEDDDEPIAKKWRRLRRPNNSDAPVPENVEGSVGKSPVYSECPICRKVLPSMWAYSQHMRKMHRNSKEEKNKPFPCDKCNRAFHFASCLNSHKSRVHHEVDGEKFQCHLCPMVSVSKSGLRRHLITVHKSESSSGPVDEKLGLKCKLCGESFLSLNDMRIHQNKTHPEAQEKLEQCHICQHISSNKLALKRHFSRLHPESLDTLLMYKCSHCPERFALKMPLLNHLRSGHPELFGLKCDVCQASFRHKRQMVQHMRSAHPGSVGGDSGTSSGAGDGVFYTCEECGKQCKSRRSLAAHKRLAHVHTPTKATEADMVVVADTDVDDASPASGAAAPDTVKSPPAPFSTPTGHYKCRICNEMLKSTDERKVHYKRDHPNESPYKCDTCDAGFATRGSLYSHRKTHDSDSRHTCDFCGKEFTRRDSFKEHLLIHTGPRYRCPHCPKEFVQKSNLNRHVRIHLGIKPYKCDQCDKAFSDKGACENHKRMHDEDNLHYCTFCGQSFRRLQKLRYHTRLHTGQGLVHCDFCAKVFTHVYALKCHLASVHADTESQLVDCSECDLKGQKAKDMAVHLATEHPNMGKSCRE